VSVWRDGETDVLFSDGQAWSFHAPRFAGGVGEDAIDGVLIAPMPGTVTVLSVQKGQRVRQGQALLVLEAMKMENALMAPFDGVVAELLVELGSQVREGAGLARIEKTT
jgi:3-methylcrotonyl-CoA carboxylase alpha subunit